MYWKWEVIIKSLYIYICVCVWVCVCVCVRARALFSCYTIFILNYKSAPPSLFTIRIMSIFIILIV
jgi:hypothetical protein